MVNLMQNFDFLGRKFIKVRFKFIITFASIFFVSQSIYMNKESISKVTIDSSTYTLFILSFLVSFVSLLFNAAAWKSLFIWMRYNDLEIDLIKLHIQTNIFKYLPGGIWHFVERVRILSKYLNFNKAVSVVCIEPFLMVNSSLLMLIFGGWQSGLLILSLLPTLIYISPLRNIIFNKLYKTSFSKFQSTDSVENKFIEKNYSLKTNSVYPFKSVILESIFILFRFLGFWLCLRAFTIDSYLSFHFWISVFVLAWTAGLIVPGAPGGVGVFESVLLLRIENLVPLAELLSVILFYRLIVTTVDLIAPVFLNLRIPNKI
tara:strand:+ start:4225 stop:5175 length:951 start_codon:yes stop_codon:yes gene_type:complete